MHFKAYDGGKGINSRAKFFPHAAVSASHLRRSDHATGAGDGRPRIAVLGFPAISNGSRPRQPGCRDVVWHLRHMSEIYSTNTPDDAFAKLLLGFVVADTGQPLMTP